jgi:PAS domain S-box-containing protein
MKLKSKIIISMIFIVFLIITGSYLAIRDIQTNILEQEFNEEGHLLANYIASETTNQLLINDLLSIKNGFDELKRSDPYIEYIYLTDNEGIVLVHTFEGGFPKELKNFSKPLSGDARNEQIIETDNGTIYDFGGHLFKNIGYVHVGLNKNWVTSQIRVANDKFIFFSGLAMVFSGGFIFFMGRWLTKPIQKLTEGVERINNGVVDQKIEVDSGDELGEFANSFNVMASNLNQKMDDLVQSRNRLEDTEKYLEMLFDSVEDGIIVTNENHEVIRANRSFLKMMAMTEDKVMNKTCHEVLYGSKASDKQRDMCEINTLLRTKQPVRFIHEIGSNDGIKSFEINASLFLDKQKSTNVIMVMREITQQKKLEDELKDSYEELRLTYSQLKDLYKVKEHFISNVSHELRTPLTSVLGYTELLLEEEITNEQRHKLEIILRNSKRLARLIQGLLDTALIDSKDTSLDKKPILVYDIVNQVAEDVRTVASIKNIPIIIEIPKDLIVMGDKDRLLQVFLNVVDNAIKFTISGEVKITGEEENENIHIRISDTGIGIPEDKIESIFERFYQVDSSNKRKYGGTGLGLWISRNFVEAQGGRIWAESKSRGSTFHILLPKMVKK